MKLILSAFLVFFAVLAGFAQNLVVEGKVTSADDKQGIPGVNILVQGTSKGAATDIDGNYKIELAPGERTLVFTFVGYKTTTVQVGERTVVDVALESDTKTLDEVVVVGYGVQRKSDITGATANIKGEDLSKQPVLTATQAMQGKIAGVQIITSGQPGSSPQIRMRGVSTAFAATTSLFVVDGVLTDDISNINTSDIVEMNVLKDASSAAIYGSRGANGVIIITTRKGVSGKIKITYNNNVGFRQAANLVPMANAAEYINYTTAATGIAPPSGTPNTSGNTDWYKTILRNAFEQNHNISLSGGSDKSTFLFNVGYMKDDGIITDNTFQRLTLRLNSDYKLSDMFRVGVQTSYSNSVNLNGFNNINIDPNGNVGGVYNDAYRAAPIIPSFVNGKFGNTSVYQNVGNPLLDIKDNAVKADNNRLQGSTFLEFKPVTWLTFKSSIGADWQNSLNRLYNYQFDNSATGLFISPGGNQLNPLSDLSIQNTQTFRWVWDNTATFNKKFNKHEFTFLAGTTAEKYYQQQFSAYRNSVPPDQSLWYIDNGNANSSQNGGNGDAWARNSYLGRLNYGYDGKYLITASVRRDGSSRLPVANRWQSYPSVGLAWVVSNETFMDQQQIFDFLKLRGSYGRVGNDQIPTDAFTETVTQNQNYPFDPSKPAQAGSQIRVIIDPHITWEVTTEYDLAVEFSLLKSKLSGEVNYYNKKLNNGLDIVPIFNDEGANPAQVISNVMGIQNKGLEVVLNWKDRISDNLSYTVSGNVTFNQNRVTALNNGQNILDGPVGNQSYVTNTDVGHPVGSFYVLKTTGVFNSDAEANSDPTNYNGLTKGAGSFKYLDKDGNGTIDINKDRVFAGSYQPVAYYGINLGIKFKNWDASMGIYGNAGNKVYNGKRASRFAGTDNIEKSLVYDRWTPSNHTQTQPAANSGNLPASDYFVESGSFIRINNLTIGYTLPADLLQRFKVSNCRVFITSQNLYTYKKYSGFTAELPGGPTNSGIETSTYPTTRTVAMGVNIGF
jgi:TonB-linked SusC/RagA family outer membrane protein